MPPGLARARYRDDDWDRDQNWDRWYDDWDDDWYGYSYRPRLFGLSNYYDNYDRRYDYYYDDDDGYLYRMGNQGVIAAYIPLLGGALALGNQWPPSYQSYAVPQYYNDYYNLGAPGSYRYADNVLYRVNPESAAITAIAALLTGNEIGIGQQMPMGYDVYNVPYPYRDRYYDTPQANYRYSDGYVYRVDPKTQLVAAAINLLTDGDLAMGQPTANRFAVGQPMPIGYDVYNVPYGYRDRYYDSPEAHYRYSDGYVYRVDPRTQLVASAIDLPMTGDRFALGQTVPNRFAIGQPMPTGYDVYNVPYRYRDQYYDTPEAHYRYSDYGYVYRVEPTTQLITAAVNLLV